MVSGNGGVVMATDRFLFVGAFESGDGQPVIRLFDISAPDGTVNAVSTIQPLGEVKDKFKMNLDGDVLTVVSEQWAASTRRTWVETFSLAILRLRKGWERSSSSREKRSSPRASTATGFMS